jgi:hypothetical protein
VSTFDTVEIDAMLEDVHADLAAKEITVRRIVSGSFTVATMTRGETATACDAITDAIYEARPMEQDGSVKVVEHVYKVRAKTLKISGSEVVPLPGWEVVDGDATRRVTRVGSDAQGRQWILTCRTNEKN